MKPITPKTHCAILFMNRHPEHGQPCPREPQRRNVRTGLSALLTMAGSWSRCAVNKPSKLPEFLSIALLLSLLPACQPKKEAPAESELALPVTTASDVAAQAAPQGNTVRYEAQPTGSEVRIAGTSTIHDWTVTNKIVGGFIETDANFPASVAKPGANASTPKAEVFIPVRAFKSYNKKMDEIMLEHLNFPKFQRIEYRLMALTPKAGAVADGALPFDATGLVTVSGVTRTNVMPVIIQRVDPNKLKVTGSTPLKMTDFGVKPPAPALALGLIKTGDDITITFEWLLAQKTEGTPRSM